MRTTLILLSIYFAACFTARAIRTATMPRVPVFNEPAVNVMACVEYAGLCAICAVVAAIG